MEEKNNYNQLILFSCLAPIYFLLFYFCTVVIPVAGYEPPYIITLNCGSAGELSALDGRKWEGDDRSKFIPPENNTNASVTATALRGPSAGPVPYLTARIFRSQFTYTFSVPSGPKFVRLHFYPVPYPEFDASKTFFSVKVGRYTFLSNFSASLTAQSLKQDSFLKEFCINVQEEDQRLNVTFIPSSETSDGYAFVNGIEIVSMPDDLYYSRSGDMGSQIVGHSASLFTIDNATAMEAIYRLNVGGRAISPVNDTGMFRSWSMDDDLMGPFHGFPLSNLTIPIKHSQKFPNYSAPDEVYRTARTMGPSKDLNVISNLTWRLPVYFGFDYLVRLHFCEFLPWIVERQNRDFHIYIDGRTAEKQADVIIWSGQNGAAAYRDYLVSLHEGGSQREYELLVQLHPNPDWRTIYNDVILNGLELFKLSNASLSLAGPNTEPDHGTDTTLAEPLSPRHQKKSNTTVIIAVGSILGAAMSLSLLIFFLLRRPRTSTQEDHSKNKSNEGVLPSDVCRHFSLAEIRTATNNFDSVFIIGRGGFGDVYKGYINGGATPVAIKRLKPGSNQGAHEFLTEIEMLSQLRHLHLVSLIGYCDDDGEMILIYEYMSHGTLRDHLFKTDNPPLSWRQRLQICVGAAKGLHYLHAGAKRMIIHRDVKTTNILLDDKWMAKVSDFGLSKINPNNMSNAHISTMVKGSIGYLDPEYYRRQQLTEKSDVYSFGVVLFEVLCARPPLDRMLERDQVSLAAWAQLCYQNGTLDHIVDPQLKGTIAPECLKKYGEIAVSCLQDDGIKRPSMNDLVWTLEFAMQLQESAEKGIKLDGAHNEFEDKDPLLFNGGDVMVETGVGHVSSSRVTMTSNSGTSSTSISSDDRMSSSGAVFSEIMNPKAR